MIAWVANMLRRLADRLAPAPVGREPALPRDLVFLFDGVDLIDASSPAWQFIDRPETGFSWSGLLAALGDRFPGFPTDPGAWRNEGPVILPAADPDQHGEALFEWIDGITRVELRPPRSEPHPGGAPPVLSELALLREMMDFAPFPAWRVDGSGAVSWDNPAHAALRARCDPPRDGAASPRPATVPLFATPPPDRLTDRRSRMAVSLGPDGPRLWYDVWSVRQDGGWLCYAVDVNAMVDAEQAQRNFVQTLAKTFAQLSIGLAIFDRNRQLALFNPALVDLTSLPAEFLSGRPHVLSFFDRLRDRRMMPEPKSYGNWRHRIAELVAAADDGRYHETWALPSGSVYAVSGRPHPDGAVAFLFEDITAEITLTRRFRADLELSQSIADGLDEALVVFLPDGTRIFTNAAYDRLWGDPGGERLIADTVTKASRRWQARCLATPAWGEIRDFIPQRDNRATWSAQIGLRGGGCIDCRVVPLPGGATLLRFAELDSPRLEQNPAVAAPAPATG